MKHLSKTEPNPLKRALSIAVAAAFAWMQTAALPAGAFAQEAQQADSWALLKTIKSKRIPSSS